MAYTTGGTIEAAHYNGFVGSVNALWGTGTGVRGIGQSSTVGTVAAGNTVTATQWSDLLNRVRSLSNHYGRNGSITIDTVSNPSAGNTISVFSTLAADIGHLDGFQAATTAISLQGATATTISNAGNFQGTFTARARLTFSSANAARYFYNAGGRVYFSTNLSGGTGDSKRNEWANLATASGNFIFDPHTSGKSGGSGTPNTNNGNAGYWDSPNGLVFRQYEDTGPYTASRIDFNIFAPNAGSATTQDFQVSWHDDAADQTGYNKNIYNVLDQVDGTKNAVFYWQPPHTTYISNTWGTPSWSTITNTIN